MGEVEQMKMDKKLALQQQQTEEELKLYTQRMDAEGRMTAVNLQKYAIDSTQRIFEKLPLKDIKVHNYMGADEASCNRVGTSCRTLLQISGCDAPAIPRVPSCGFRCALLWTRDVPRGHNRHQ